MPVSGSPATIHRIYHHTEGKRGRTPGLSRRALDDIRMPHRCHWRGRLQALVRRGPGEPCCSAPWPYRSRYWALWKNLLQPICGIGSLPVRMQEPCKAFTDLAIIAVRFWRIDFRLLHYGSNGEGKRLT